MKKQTITTPYLPGLGDFLDMQEYRGITWRPCPHDDNKIEIIFPDFAFPAQVAFDLAMRFNELDRIAVQRIDDIQNR